MNWGINANFHFEALKKKKIKTVAGRFSAI